MTLHTLIPATPAVDTYSALSCFTNAIELLEDLPNDPDSIARLLEDVGVTGVPSSGETCVLAEYVRDVAWPEGIKLSVIGMALAVEVSDKVEFVYNLSPHLYEFVKRFDGYEYPALIRFEGVL